MFGMQLLEFIPFSIPSHPLFCTVAPSCTPVYPFSALSTSIHSCTPLAIPDHSSSTPCFIPLHSSQHYCTPPSSSCTYLFHSSFGAIHHTSVDSIDIPPFGSSAHLSCGSARTVPLFIFIVIYILLLEHYSTVLYCMVLPPVMLCAGLP